MRILRNLTVAFTFMTRIPMPAVIDYRDSDLRDAAPYFPVTGGVVGSGVALLMWALADRPWLAALAALLFWVGVTGALHLDGLGDVADAFGAAHRSPDRFLEVLKDPHLGVFGAVTIAMQLVTKLVLLHELADGGFLLAIVLVPAWARWSTLLCSKVLPPLEGATTATHGAPRTWAPVVIPGVVITGVSVVAGPATLLALPLALAAILYWKVRLGGASGDCYGASIEVLESLLLSALVPTF